MIQLALCQMVRIIRVWTAQNEGQLLSPGSFSARMCLKRDWIGGWPWTRNKNWKDIPSEGTSPQR